MTRHRFHSFSRSGGFTLLELILALGMTCVLAVSLFATLRVAFRARDSASAAVEKIRGVQIALNLFGQDLKAAMPPQGVDNNTGLLAQEFQGQESGTGSITGSDLDGSVVFYALKGDEAGVNDTPGTTDQDPIQFAGIRKIEWGIERNGNQNDLVRLEWTNLLSEVDQPDPDKREVILSDIDSFYLEYTADGETWDDVWDSTAESDTMPIAIDAVLTLKDDNGASYDRVYSLPMAVPIASGGQ